MGISKETPVSIFNCPIKIYPILLILHENLNSVSSLTAAQLQEMHVHNTETVLYSAQGAPNLMLSCESAC